jgi:hypothetical protein
LFSDPHKTHNTLCGQNVELLNVKPSGTYSEQLTLNTKPACRFAWEMNCEKHWGYNRIIHTHTHTHTSTYQCHTILRCHCARTETCSTNQMNRLHQLQQRYTTWRHSPMWMRVRNNWLLFIHLWSTARREQNVCIDLPVNIALSTYFRPFVSLDNYGDLWRTVCSLTHICCSGDNLISLRTSWKQPEGQISQIWTPLTTGYLDDPLHSFKNGEDGAKILTQLTGI